MLKRSDGAEDKLNVLDVFWRRIRAEVIV